jgi:hypothetical protein
MTIFAYLLVPETKGKSLEELDEIFDAKVGKSKAIEMVPSTAF